MVDTIWPQSTIPQLTDAAQLTKEEEDAMGDEVEVRREDQDKINKFSRLHQHELSIEEELSTLNVSGPEKRRSLRDHGPDSLSRRKKRRSSTTSRPSSSLPMKTIPSRESDRYSEVAMQGAHADHGPATKSGMPSSTCSSHRRRKCSGYRR